MKNNIIKLDEIYRHRNFLGAKTKNLKKCIDKGFRAPKFVAVSSEITQKVFQEKDFREKIAQKVISTLRCKRYAVRSSALIEDGKTESFAGQFLTKTNLSENDLERGIFEVLSQAKEYLKGDLKKFSLIVQEYIIPDVFGVTFTRNPSGNREMMIEYGFCEGEKIVSGEIKPLKLSLYWNQTPTSTKIFTKKLINDFKKIEQYNNFPQDIEWCTKDDEFYILQTRDITTISKQEYEQILFLEKVLSEEKQYFYEKTEISENTPRPCQITYDLVQRIYDDNGPVSKKYKKYGISYRDTQFLKIIGNELFIDKEKEIKSLLPVYTYFSDSSFELKMKGGGGILKTLKNIFLLNTIKTNKYEALFEEVKKILESENQIESVEEATEHFLKEYETIFEINLLTGLSFKKIELLLKKESVSVTSILDNQDFFISLEEFDVNVSKNLKGNCLDIMDESKLVQKKFGTKNSNEHIQNWWNSLSKYKKSLLEERIKEMIFYNYLRELGRYLTVKNLNILRNELFKYAKNKKFKNASNIYFCSLSHVCDEKTAINNKIHYHSADVFNFPNKILHSFNSRRRELEGVSFGKATGKLQNIEFLKSNNTNSEKIILYTEFLSPQITQYFDRVSGIVSENGGILSHLSIIAREQKIPIVTGFRLGKDNIQLGDIIEINGEKGKINKNKNKKGE